MDHHPWRRPPLGTHMIIATRHPSHEDLWTLIRQIVVFEPKTVLSEAAFKRIPRRRLRFMARRKRRMNQACAVCMQEFGPEEQEPLKVLRCEHAFHTDCIRPWLCEEASTCPVCRTDQAADRPGGEE